MEAVPTAITAFRMILLHFDYTAITALCALLLVVLYFILKFFAKFQCYYADILVLA